VTTHSDEAPGAKALGHAVALLTVTRLGSVAAGFLTSLIAARLIGPGGIGLVGAAITIATIGALFASGGLNIASVYYLGRRPEQRTAIVGQVFALGLVAALLGALGVLIASWMLRDTTLGDAPLGLLLVTAALAAGLLQFELGGGVLLGLHRRIQYIGAQAIEALASLALTALILLVVSRTATGFLVAAALGYWAGALAAWVSGIRHVGAFRISFSRQFGSEALAIGLRGQVGNLLQFLNLRFDLLLVPALVNLPAAGIYFVAVRVSEAVTQVSNSAAAFLFPQVAAQREAGATNTTEAAIRLTLVVVVAGGLLLAIFAGPVLSVFGETFPSGAGALRILLVAMLPLSAARLLAADLKGRGRPGIVSLGALLAVVTSVAADLVLIPPLGIEGAALASVIAYTVSAGALLLAYLNITSASPAALVPRVADLRNLITVSASALAAIARARDPRP
jgi:stage V sporulation protein B